MKIKKEVQKLISDNKIQGALEVFHNWAVQHNNDQLQNSLILIQSRFARLKQQENLGIIQFSDSLREQAIVSNAILEFLSQIEESEIAPVGAAEEIDERKTILFLASNPAETSKLQLEKEFVRIFNGIQEGAKELKLVSEWAVSPGGLQQAILKHRPNIIHFAGHGASEGLEKNARGILEERNSGGIVLQGVNGEPRIVSTTALVDLFETMRKLEDLTIEVVVLNACHQEAQARAISQFVPYVIGTNNAIDDNVAIEFSTGFYRGISAVNSDIEFAFRLAKNNIMLEGLADSMVPVLYRNNLR